MNSPTQNKAKTFRSPLPYSYDCQLKYSWPEIANNRQPQNNYGVCRKCMDRGYHRGNDFHTVDSHTSRDRQNDAFPYDPICTCHQDVIPTRPVTRPVQLHASTETIAEKMHPYSYPERADQMPRHSKSSLGQEKSDCRFKSPSRYYCCESCGIQLFPQD